MLVLNQASSSRRLRSHCSTNLLFSLRAFPSRLQSINTYSSTHILYFDPVLVSKMTTTSSKIRKFKHTFAPQTSPASTPHEIQASLLHVGMRVRKSVGQGYNTERAIEEKKLRSERASLASKSPCSRFNGKSGITIMVDDRSIDDNQCCPSSQDSLSSVSTQDSASSSPYLFSKQKRKWADELKEDSIDSLLIGDHMETMSTCLRPIAQARSIRHSILAQRGLSIKDEIRKSSGDLDDFEEADFLVPNP